jgi:iron complex transport system permease protein
MRAADDRDAAALGRRRLLWLALAVTPAVAALCLLVGPAGFGWPAQDTEMGRAVLTLRVYRLLAALAVGASLSCAGAVFQALLRNPLAEPYVLGVSSGAGLGAAAAILSGFAAWHALALPLTAFVGALVTLGAVYRLAREGSGAPSVYGLILSGVIVSAVCSSLLMSLVALAPVEGMHSVVWWMLGDLQPASGSLLAACAGIAGVTCSTLWFLSRDLNALTLGREMAHHVGVRTGVVVNAGLVLATLATSAAVGLAGLIGFVGLIVPHVARAAVGPDHRRLLPVCALGGGLFLAVCDAMARSTFGAQEIPVGVVTALFGGPFFLALLRRKRMGWTA